MTALSALPWPYPDILLAAGELACVLVFYMMFRLLARAAIRGMGRASGSERAHQVGRALGAGAGVVLAILAVLLALGVIGADLFLFYTGQGVAEGTAARIAALPPGFFMWLGLAVAKCIGLFVAAAIAIAIVRRVLAALHRLCVRSARITATEADLAGFFGLLASMAANAIRLIALATALAWLGLDAWAEWVLVGLRIYLLIAAGALVVRAVKTAVDALDTLSLRFTGPDTPFHAYREMRGLVPLLRRCLELVVWLAVAALVLLQLPSVAGLAPFGPRLMEVVAIVFLARVGAEAVNLVMDRTQGGQPELSELERQQRATLVPLVRSFLRGVVYFIAIVLILGALDFNPLPLLAGAGVVGVVVGLGAQAVITDLVSGFFILVESQFLVGDYIETGSARGIVEAIQLRTSRIRDPNGQQHIIRNGQITGVVNHSKSYTFAVVEVDVPYDADLDRVYGLIRSVGDRFAAENADVLEPTSIAGLEHFSKSGLQVRTTTKVKPGTHGQVARELRQAIFEAFRAGSLVLAG